MILTAFEVIGNMQMNKLSEIQIPSNRNFGIFFTLIFSIFCGYFLYEGYHSIAYIFLTLASTFFLVLVTNAELLLPINKLWMHFGLLLNKIISPLILGAIYFGLFTPIAIYMRIIRRDELRLRTTKLPSMWKRRQDDSDFLPNFENQF